ncbi:DNA methyltransferase [Belnapia moabensis]|uniref:DNA methyltransferase n=1 Tax=Belnapia moabensis TaxID=365533 RepID=UPI0009FF4FD3|nr:DNA methyltransferase [Belnapia moabensis]
MRYSIEDRSLDACYARIAVGSAEGDRVLDPFAGAGTTGLIAEQMGRDATLIELNADYAEMARVRLASTS